MKISSMTTVFYSAKNGFLLLGALAGVSLAQGAWADSSYAEAEVVAVSSLYETVTYSEPREECRLERVAYSDREQRSGTPKLVGALIGGALGNALGAKEPNKKVGAVVGGLLGYSIGKDERLTRWQWQQPLVGEGLGIDLTAGHQIAAMRALGRPS